MKSLCFDYARAAALAAALAGGCSGSDDAASNADGSNSAGGYVAFTSAFEGFRSWESFELNDDSPETATLGGMPVTIHPAGPRTVYLNMRPKAGSTTFPQQTIIVKEMDMGPLETRNPFAAVKRGGGFGEALGDPGWEWFELQNNPDGTVARIIWRGWGPQPGSTTDVYGGDPTVCIDCHKGAANNDFVQSPPLQLSNF